MAVLSDLSGGRNGVQSPVSKDFPTDQSVEAINVDYRNGGLGRKRAGSYDVLANTTGQGFTAPLYSLIRHVTTDETLGEVWGLDSVSPTDIYRLPAAAPGTVWSVVSGGPVITSRIPDVSGVSFNGKLFIFLNSATDRLKVYDAGSNTIRYVGLSAPAAPTVADTGAGAYAAVARQYRVRYAHKSGTTYVRISEPSALVSFTPSGTGTAARVTKPAAITEGETHWIIEASTDSTNFYRLAEVVVATTTYDDSAATTTYPSGALSELSGTYTLPTSFKFGVTDGNRLIMAGNWLDGNGSRVAWTPVLGSLNRGDDERIFKTATLIPFLDLDAKSGGDLTGIGHINGVIYCFKYRQVWRLSPTGDLFQPYAARRVSSVIGAITHKSIALGEDALGNACLYFMSHKGPYRVGPNGLEYVGRDIEDITRDTNGAPNINTAATIVVSHSIFHIDLGQWWVWFATGANNFPNELLILDVKRATRRDSYGVRGGWTRMNGEITTAVCSCLGQAIFGQTGNLLPWLGIGNSTFIISIAGKDSVQSDRGVGFKAYVKTAALRGIEFGRRLRVAETTMLAKHNTAAPVTITQSLIRDVQQETTKTSVTMKAADIGSSLPYKFEGSMIADARVVQVQLGDDVAAINQWQIDELHYAIADDGDA